ncbi:MAG: hypothetical protein ACK5N0_05820 [Synechococcaceae cyanobacterium]
MLDAIGHQLELLEQELLTGCVDQRHHRVSAVIRHHNQTLMGVLGFGHDVDVWVQVGTFCAKWAWLSLASVSEANPRRCPLPNLTRPRQPLCPLRASF